MPVMKYHCNNCGNEFAKIFFNLEQAPKECPVCRTKDPEELGPAFHQDAASIARAMCGSCDSCGTDYSTGNGTCGAC